MKYKKYEEVKRVKNKLESEINTNFKVLRRVSIGMTIIALIISIACMKLGIENEALMLENEDLKKGIETLSHAVETKDSMIADLEENCKDLFIENQNLKFGGNK